MEDFILAAMLLVIFGGAALFATGMLFWMGAKRVFAPVCRLVKK